MPFVQLGRLKAYYERSGIGSRLLFVSGSGGDLRAKPGVFESPLARAFDLLGIRSTWAGPNRQTGWTVLDAGLR